MLAQVSNLMPSSSSTAKFNLKAYYAPQDSSADKILERIKSCLSSLESNIEPLNASKVEFYNYVKFHWDHSQQLFKSYNYTTANKLQKACLKLILQGVVYKLFDKEISINFSDSNGKSYKLNAYQTTIISLISPMIKSSFDYEFKESQENLLSLPMPKEIFLKIIEIAKIHEVFDEQILNNILQIYDNVNLLRIEYLQREIVNYILIMRDAIDFENLITIYDYFSKHATNDSKIICEGILIRIGEGYIQQSKLNQANALIESANQAKLDISKIHYLKSCVYTAQEDFISALNSINLALEQNSKESLYKIKRAHINYKLSDLTEVLKDVDPIVAHEPYPHNLEALIQRGLVYFDKLEYMKAGNDFYKVLQMDRYNALALNKIGDIYQLIKRKGDNSWQQGKYKESLKNYHLAVQMFPHNPLCLSRRGEAYRMLKDNTMALQDFDQVLQIEPHNIIALAGRGDIYRQNRKFAEALRELNKALQIQPNNPCALRRRAHLFIQQGKYDESLKDLDNALQLEPNSLFALSVRGNIYRQQDKYEEALKDLDAALRINPKDPFALSVRGNVYSLQSKCDEALKDLDAALKINPDNRFALFVRSEVYRLQANYESAILDLGRIRQNFPPIVDPFTLYLRANVHRVHVTIKGPLDPFQFEG